MEVGMWTFVTIIAVAGILGQSYRTRLKYQHRRESSEDRSRDDDIDDLMRRVATLESIVTDPKSRLKDQIENL